MAFLLECPAYLFVQLPGLENIGLFAAKTVLRENDIADSQRLVRAHNPVGRKDFREGLSRIAGYGFCPIRVERLEHGSGFLRFLDGGKRTGGGPPCTSVDVGGIPVDAGEQRRIPAKGPASGGRRWLRAIDMGQLKCKRANRATRLPGAALT